MEVDNYQRAAARTLIDKPDFILTPEYAQAAVAMIRLGAHIGRIMEYTKKGIFHQHGFSLDELDRLCREIAEINTDPAALDDDAVMMIWNTIGYIGEACEVAGLLEETILQGKPLDVAELGKELGDGAWYPAALATRAGLRMSDVLAANLDKLRTRYPNGYSAADSVARVDVGPLDIVAVPPGARVAELCGACLEYKDQATMTPCHCGADICAECTADGVTRCYICSDGGSVC